MSAADAILPAAASILDAATALAAAAAGDDVEADDQVQLPQS